MPDQSKVLLTVLSERTSAAGNRYLSGWLGKARVVGFLDKDATASETIWNVFVQTPAPKSE